MGIKQGDVLGDWTVVGAPFSRGPMAPGNNLSRYQVVVACTCGAHFVVRCVTLRRSKGHAVRAFNCENHTPLDIAEFVSVPIKERLRSGEAKLRLAREYGVSDTAIHYISIGRTWGHVA